MTPEEVRKIIREELGNLILSDKYVFNKLIQIMDGRNIQTGRTTGTKFPQASDQLFAHWGTTPVNQPETIADPSDAPALYDQATAQNWVNTIKTIIDRLIETGDIKSA